MTRREFIRNALRFAALGALGFGGVKLASKSGTRHSEVCTYDGICSGCPTASACGLPRGLSYKQTKKVSG